MCSIKGGHHLWYHACLNNQCDRDKRLSILIGKTIYGDCKGECRPADLLLNEVHHLRLAVRLPQQFRSLTVNHHCLGRSDSLRELPRSYTSSESSYSFKSHGAPHLDGSDTDNENDRQSDFEDEPFQPSNFSANLTQLTETLRGGALLAQVEWLPERRKLVVDVSCCLQWSRC